MDFKAGDVVALRSNAETKLVIESVDGEEVACVWLNQQCEVTRAEIKVAALFPLMAPSEAEPREQETVAMDTFDRVRRRAAHLEAFSDQVDKAMSDPLLDSNARCAVIAAAQHQLGVDHG